MLTDVMDGQTVLDELERDIQIISSPISFKAGCLTVLDCGQGWLKVSLKEHSLEPLAELLPPAEAKMFIHWLKMKFN